MALKYKIGDRVRIKSLDWYKENKDENGNIRYKSDNSAYPIFFTKYMSRFCGETLTIKCVHKGSYYMNETGSCEFWTDEMIECKVEEEMSLDKAGQITDFEYEGLAYTLPDGYQFVDENGNVINETKIVLEKKKKDVNLTQEQINKMVHDSCVSFCKHCGCGIPRDTCTSLGTCKEHDEYRATIKTHLMEKKKKEYPKTYAECCEALEYIPHTDDIIGYKWNILQSLQKLLICRDAYWKIAGEEMGLDKPWKPDWLDDATHKFIIHTIEDEIYCGVALVKNHLFAFPTEEMRDHFYENFKELIESCKELL